MGKDRSGTFGSRNGIPTPAVLVQGNNLQFNNDPKPWFADLDHLAAEATALTTSAGMVIPFVSNGELVIKVDRVALNADLVILNTHVAAMLGRLALLKADTEKYRETIKKIRPDSVPTLLNHAEFFQLFMNDWTRIAFFAMDNVLEHFRKVGVDIPYICPYSPGYRGAVSANQMSAEQFEQATAPLTAETLMQEIAKQ